MFKNKNILGENLFMLDFKELELSDKEKIEPFLAIDGSIMADRTFASLYIWREHYDVQICLKNDFFIFSRRITDRCEPIICRWAKVISLRQ